jgi:hypothetical protein
MRSFRTLAAIALCAWLPFAGVAASRNHSTVQEALELPVVAHSAGEVVRSSYHSNSSLHTVVLTEGKITAEFDTVEDKTGSKIVRVLATDVHGPSRLRVEYGALKAVRQNVNAANTAAAASDLDEVDERNPLQGRAFTLQREPRGFRVLDENGVRVAEGLARLVIEEEGVNGDQYEFAGDRVARELAGRTLPIGVDIPLSQDAARAFVDGRDGAGEVRFIVTPKETRDEDGARITVFAARYSIRHAGSGGEPDATVDLRGEMHFEASTGRFLSLQLDGLLTLESMSTVEARTLEVTGQGPWSIHASARYER